MTAARSTGHPGADDRPGQISADGAAGADEAVRAADGVHAELAGDLAALLRLTAMSCPSRLAVTLTCDRDGVDLTMVSVTAAASQVAPPTVVPALTVPLPRPDSTGPSERPAVLTVYATDRGELTRLGADITVLLECDAREVALHTGAQLPPARTVAAALAAALAELSTVDRALGALLDAGWPPEQGHAELHRHADNAGLSLTQAAEHVLAAIPRPSQPADP